MTGGETRAQSGMDRLALFVLLVLAVVAATPFVLDFAGVDVRAPPDGGNAAGSNQGPPKLVVLSAEGHAIDANDQSVGAVRMVVTRSNDDRPVDLSAVTVSWSNGGAYTVAHTDSAGEAAAGVFAGSLLRAERRGSTLSESGDRGVIRFDVGTDDIGGLEEFGSRLEAGETVTVRLHTTDGRVTTANLTIPDRLPAGNAVDL